MAKLSEDKDIAPMPCWCGSKLRMDTENEIYICVDCGKPEEECECEYH